MMTTPENVLHEAYGLNEIEIQPTDGGLINHNFRVRSSHGEYALKQYSSWVSDEALEFSLSLTTWLNEHMKSHHVPRSIPALDGRLYVTNHQRWVLQTLCPGDTVAFEHLSLAQTAALGEALAAVHRTLDLYPYSRRQHQRPEWPNSAGALQRCTELLELMGDAPLGPFEQLVHQLIDFKTAYLTRHEIGPSQFYHLGFELSHGDYHLGNVLYQDNTVVSVLDWDNACDYFRGYDLMRCMGFICMRGGQWCYDYMTAFMGGYLSLGEVTAEERRILPELWFCKLMSSNFGFIQHYTGTPDLSHSDRIALQRYQLMRWLHDHKDELGERLAQL